MNKQKNKAIGISDISVYLPRPKINIDSLVIKRIESSPELEKHLHRAVSSTGQKAIRYTSLREDTVTMAAEAAKKVVEKLPASRAGKIRHIAAGTETGVDHSKPLSAYVGGLLQKADLGISQNISSFQVQHACASGTMALLSVGALINMEQEQDELGLVLCSDIAHYNTGTTAEITQGAGASGILVEKNPKLLEMDFSTIGYCSHNVDDFFRPIGSKFAQVKGRFSMQCYIDNFKEAVLDHCSKKNISVQQMLADTDYFVLHTPFSTMPEKAMQALLKEHIGLVNGQTEAYLKSHGFYDGTEPISRIGNTYSASLYISLAHLLETQYKKLGAGIVGKNVLLASYGSGNTMVVISARIAEKAPDVISAWDLDSNESDAVDMPLDYYEEWTQGPYKGEEFSRKTEGEDIPYNRFYLEGIREDGYREYGYRKQVDHRNEEAEAPGHLHRSEALHG